MSEKLARQWLYTEPDWLSVWLVVSCFVAVVKQQGKNPPCNGQSSTGIDTGVEDEPLEVEPMKTKTHHHIVPHVVDCQHVQYMLPPEQVRMGHWYAKLTSLVHVHVTLCGPQQLPSLAAGKVRCANTEEVDPSKAANMAESDLEAQKRGEVCLNCVEWLNN